MDDMIAGIGMKYDLRSGYQHPPSEVPNFFKLLAASVEKSAWWQRFDLLQAVTHLMVLKLKYNFLN
jgi:hypothetical protein